MFRYSQEMHVTIDKSLKSKSRLVRSRNVLKREERIAQLQFEDNWKAGQSPYGLPKVRVMKTTVGRKKKKKAKEDEGEETTEAV
ncbi:MAG: small basic protein [Planctomycetaceae bacterium]